MPHSVFQQLDNMRFERTLGKKTRIFARVVFGMMFFLRRSDDPAYRKRFTLAEEYCRQHVPLHAQAGLCLTMTGNYIWTQAEGAESLYPVLSQYPGLIAGNAADMTFSLGDEMLPINWLNAVHNDLLDRCGGRESVLSQIDQAGFELWNYDNGLVVQAGPEPLLGNQEAGAKMPHYGVLARALKPARISSDERNGSWRALNYRRPDDIYDHEQDRATQHEYLTRFDAM